MRKVFCRSSSEGSLPSILVGSLTKNEITGPCTSDKKIALVQFYWTKAIFVRIVKPTLL
ncbi:hypothetical protein J15TS10_06010 [Paenibacillus woosongensis]|uniref:Uncharacterized protein n=1 Tax=Paenibacillus woosongensis TaxID=307580 RepID=A0ABQ4MM88_9BACL|nr:hypothetical protein J15TS10_06010 [Paenibacillus woosongensis]